MNDKIELLRSRLDALFGETFFAKLDFIQESAAGDHRYDLLAQLTVGGKKARIALELKDSGEPRFARMTAYKLLKVQADLGADYSVFAAPYISDKSRAICRELGVGALDLAGNAFVAFDRIFIDRRGNPNPFEKKERIKSIYSPKSSRVPRALLNDPKKRWFVRDLAASIGISVGQVSNVKRALLDREWVREEGRAFWLSEPGELLQDWAGRYEPKKNVPNRYYSPLGPAEIEKKIAEMGGPGTRYALAFFSGARRLAPFVLSPLVHAFVEPSALVEIAARAGLKEAESGANVVLLSPYDEGVWSDLIQIDGFSVCSAVQLYLDLINHRGRGEEAAEIVLKKRIEPTW